MSDTRGLAEAPSSTDVFLPFRLCREGGELAFLSTIAVFGTALDVTLSELLLEAFYPADRKTAAALEAYRSPVSSS